MEDHPRGGFAKLPEHSCVYNDFDPSTLRPKNKETAIRELEIDLQRLSVAAKRVLDIGCNNGFVSLRCVSAGAAHVTAMDVREEYLDFLRQVVETQGFGAQVSVVNANFREIPTRDYQSDVVFFLEVLHWITSQGETLQQSVRRLWELTRETLVLEFPWSIEEPSIRAQTTLTAEDYDARLIFRLLTHYFNAVEILGFAEYMGAQSGSCRVLVVAREPKVTPILDSFVPGMGRRERCLGAGKLWLSMAADGAYAVKRLPANAKLLNVPPPVCRHFLTALEGSSTFSIPKFKQFDGGSIVFSSDAPRNERYLVYPWIGALDPPANDPSRGFSTWPQVRGTALEVTRLLIAPAEAEVQSWINRKAEECHAALGKFAKAKNIAFARAFDRHDWSLGHGDIHLTNVLMLDGETYLFDIETLWVYPQGFDALWAMILCGIRDEPDIVATVRLLHEMIMCPSELQIIALASAFERWRDLVLDGRAYDKDAFSDTEEAFARVTDVCRRLIVAERASGDGSMPTA